MSIAHSRIHFSATTLLLLMSMLLVANTTSCTEAAAPEDTAIKFFQALYVDKDIETAKRLAGSDIAELIGHYRNFTEIHKYVVGMVIPPPEISIIETSSNFFGNYHQNEVEVTLHFTAYKGGHTFEDVRTVIVSRVSAKAERDPLNGGWHVTEIKPDPFGR